MVVEWAYITYDFIARAAKIMYAWKVLPIEMMWFWTDVLLTILLWNDINKDNVYRLQVLLSKLNAIFAIRTLLKFYGRNSHSSVLAVHRIVVIVSNLHILYNNNQVPIRPRTSQCNANITARQVMRKTVYLAITRLSQQLRLSDTTIWRILKKDLG